MTGRLCQLPHYDHPESTCTQPAGHHGPHAAPLIINSQECGALAWGPDSEEQHHLTSDNAPNLNDAREKITPEAKGSDPRPTASTINDAQLDQLYDRLERAETFVTTVAEIIADHEGDEWASHAATTAIRRGFGSVSRAVPDIELRRQLDAAIRALGKSEAAIARARALHHQQDSAYCAICTEDFGRIQADWPCPTIAALDQPAPSCPDPIECGHEAALGQAEEAARRALEQRQEMAAERYAWQERAARAEATIARVQKLLDSGPIGTCCDRLVRAALDEPAPATPTTTQTTEPYPPIGLTGDQP